MNAFKVKRKNSIIFYSAIFSSPTKYLFPSFNFPNIYNKNHELLLRFGTGNGLRVTD